MNMTDKTRSYIWLVLAILSLICVVSRVMDLAYGSKEWRYLVASIVMTAFCTRSYLCYRKKAQEA